MYVFRVLVLALLILPLTALAVSDVQSIKITNVEFSSDFDTTTVTLSADPGGKVHIRANVFPVSLGRDTSGVGYNTQEKVSVLSGWASDFQSVANTGEAAEFNIVFRVCPYDEPYTGKHTDDYCGEPYTTYVRYQPGSAFKDVSTSHPNAEAIAYVKAQGIVGGYADGTYKPDQAINRAEFTKIIMNARYTQEELADCLERVLAVHPQLFTDVNATSWFSTYICMAKSDGIIAGYPDGSFRPAQNISFVEASKILSLGLHEPIPSVAEVPVTEPWYYAYVTALQKKNAIPLTISSFDQPITRGEMAEVMYRLKANITNMPSKTYEELSNQKADLRVYHYTHQLVDVSFSVQYPEGSIIDNGPVAPFPGIRIWIPTNESVISKASLEIAHMQQCPMPNSLAKNFSTSHIDGLPFQTWEEAKGVDGMTYADKVYVHSVGRFSCIVLTESMTYATETVDHSNERTRAREAEMGELRHLFDVMVQSFHQE